VKGIITLLFAAVLLTVIIPAQLSCVSGVSKESTTNTEKIINDYTEAWNSHDVDKIISFYTDDGVYEDMANGQVAQGKEKLRPVLTHTFFILPDNKVELKSVFTADDRAATEWLMTGTYPVTNKSCSVQGASIYQLRDGKISRYAVYYDMNLFMKQIGLTPALSPTPAPAPAPTPAPVSGAATSFPSATYTNDQYGFSIQYPKDWVARPDLMTSPYMLAMFGVPSFVPVLGIGAFDADAPVTKDWIIETMEKVGYTNPKITSDIEEEALAGGIKAYTFKAESIAPNGYGVVAYYLQAEKDGKCIRVGVVTVDTFVPYDEKLFSEIAHTLTFK
jgi:steroid delta-isomerase-like uncharacterized protein